MFGSVGVVAVEFVVVVDVDVDVERSEERRG